MPRKRQARRTATRSRYRSTDPLEQVQASIRDWVDAHSLQVAAQGGVYLSRVGDFSWNSDQTALMCPVEGSRAPYWVSLERHDDGWAFAEASCSCPYSSGWELCKHTYAALRKLEQRLADPRDSLVQRLFGVGGSSPWQVALMELDQFIQRREASAKTDSPAHGKRLTWRIEYVQGRTDSTLSVVPYEQKRSKNGGGWTRGRKVVWDRLMRDSELWTTAADEKIARLVKEASTGFSFYAYYGATETLSMLEHLVGHPLVFWSDDPQQPVEICAGTVGLAIEKVRGGLQLHPAIDGLPPETADAVLVMDEGDRKGLVRIDREQNRITIAPSDVAVLDLTMQMNHLTPKIPKEHQDELLARLTQLEAHLPVTLPDALLGGEIEADRRMFLRLSPQAGGGLEAEMKVRPAEDGIYLEPGGGRPELTATADKKRLRVVRDLDRESRLGREIAESLGLSNFPEMRDWHWRLLDDDHALDLIAAAQDYVVESDNLVVEWPEGAKLSVSQEVGPQALKVQIEDRKDWFGLKGMLQIDGEDVPLDVILAALRHGSKYVAIGKNKWVRIAQAFRERLAALSDVVHASRSGLQFDATAAPVLDELIDDKAALKACRRWKDVVRRLDEAGDLCPEPPITLTAELRDYQLEGYRWLRRLAAWGVGGCLADDMGLGKTVQTLSVLIDRVEEGPALVVAPTSVGFNWARETERFAPTLRAILYRETDRGEFLNSVSDGDVVVISYGLLQRDAEKLAEVSWGTLVLDEAQKIKNSQTKTARAVRTLDAKWRLALTGTPVENHLGELWSIFRAISPGLFGGWEHFRQRFAEPIERKKDIDRRKALAHTVRPFVLRRTKSEVLEELPQRTEVQRTAELSEAERKQYEEVRLSAVAKLAGLAGENGERDRRFEVLAALTKLRQLACHPKLVDASWKLSSAKLDLFLEIVEELIDGNHRALVFSQFTQHLSLLRDALDERGVSYRYLDGTTSAKKRADEVDAFQRGEGELFLISLKAGGTGLNLTAADYVIHMDPWWNPAVEDQATDRAHRIGQTRPVTVYRLVAKDTIEEQILALHADKRDLVAGVLEGADRAGKLSTQELISLIKTGGEPEAAVEGEEAKSAPLAPKRKQQRGRPRKTVRSR